MVALRTTRLRPSGGLLQVRLTVVVSDHAAVMGTYKCRPVRAGEAVYPAAATASPGGARGQRMAPLRTSERINWHERSAIAVVQV